MCEAHRYAEGSVGRVGVYIRTRTHTHIHVRDTAFMYTPRGNKGFRQGWMVRGGSSLHCSRWNPNAIHKGATHYPACIYHTHTRLTCSRLHEGVPTLARPQDRVYPDVHRGGVFHGVQNRTYTAANCAVRPARALIFHKMVKSAKKFIRRVQSNRAAP